MKVLVVDDDRKFSNILVGELKRLGHDARSANTAEESIAILFEGSVDLLLTELRMGSRDGLELIEFARDASPKTRSVLMSARATAQDYKKALSAGVVEVLTKPFNARELEKVVKKASECQEGFRGNIHGLNLPDILQVLSMSRSSVTVKVGQTGLIFLDKGELVHAISGNKSGVPAVRELLATRGGVLETAPASPEVPRTIHQRLDHLLLSLEVAIDTAAVDPERAQEIERDVTAEHQDVLPPLVPPRSRSWLIPSLFGVSIAAFAAYLLLRTPDKTAPAELVAQPPAPVEQKQVEAPPLEPIEPKEEPTVAEKVIEPRIEPPRPRRVVAKPQRAQVQREVSAPKPVEKPAVVEKKTKKPTFDTIDDNDFDVIHDDDPVPALED